MALPSDHHKCLICLDEVTDAEYRRELTCSYVACPGSNHAYHEECINEYLRKQKLPVDRLIGYACPVVLDNGRPCTGRITATHHRHPLNQKKKQKRVDAAAAAAAVPKPKPPAPKPKEPKQAANAVALVTAAMRPAGEAALRQAGVTITSLKSVASSLPTVKASISNSPSNKLAGVGTAAAVSNNSAMAPDRVVRQRVIPGWSGSQKVSKLSTLEQQRAQVAALRAEARGNAGRSAKGAAVAAGGGGGGPAAAAAGVMAAAAAAGQKEAGKQGRAAQQQLFDDQDGPADNVSEDSDSHPFSRWLRDGDSTDSADDGAAAAAEQQQQQLDPFYLAPEDFPAFPASPGAGAFQAAGAAFPAPGAVADVALTTAPVRAMPSAAVGPHTEIEQQLAVSTDWPYGTAVPAAYDTATPVSPSTSFDESDVDPVVAHDQLYQTEDGAVVVQDAYGNYVRMEDVYGEAPELVGYADESGVPTYYVVIRQSHVAAQLAAQEGLMALNGDAGVLISGPGNPTAQLPDGAAGAVVAAAAGHDHGFGLGRDAYGLDASAYGAVPPVPEPANDPAPPSEEADLDDLLALCMGGAPPAAAAAAEALVVAPASPAAPYGATDGAQHTFPYGKVVAGGAGNHPFGEQPPLQQAHADAHAYGAYVYGADMYGAARADAFAGCVGLEPPEGEDVSSLMQLLCV